MMLLSVAACGVSAQQEASFPLHYDVSLYLGAPSKGNLPMGLLCDLGYNPVRHLTVHALFHTDYFVPKEGKTDGYNEISNLGGGIGYLFCLGKQDTKAIEARMVATTTMGHHLLGNTTYMVGVYAFGVDDESSFLPIIGVGYAIRNFHVDSPTCYGPYVSLGFRF